MILSMVSSMAEDCRDTVSGVFDSGDVVIYLFVVELFSVCYYFFSFISEWGVI